MRPSDPESPATPGWMAVCLEIRAHEKIGIRSRQERTPHIDVVPLRGHPGSVSFQVSFQVLPYIRRKLCPFNLDHCCSSCPATYIQCIAAAAAVVAAV